RWPRDWSSDVCSSDLLRAIYLALRVAQIAEDDGAARARGLACCHHFAVADPAALLFRLDARARNALHAVGAFLHHAAHAHGDFGVELRLERLGARGVVEEVEAPHLVRAVLRAEARADAAVVDLDVEALAVMHGCIHWADVFARRVLAVHARHRLEERAFSLVVAIDADPVHLPPGDHLVLAHRGDVVLRLAGDGAG